MPSSNERKPIFTLSLLVTGNVLGVGVLALPIKAGLGGFWPAVVGILIVWTMMLISGIVIASRLKAEGTDSFDIPSFFAQEIGPVGRYIAIVCNLILLYGVLTAYLSGITVIITSLFQHVGLPLWGVTVIYFLIASGFVLMGTHILRHMNLLVMLLLWGSFFVLVYVGLDGFQAVNLTNVDWMLFPLGLPIAVSAFHYHNIIPSVYRAVNRDLNATCKAIVLGLIIGLVINLVWIVVTLGGLPEVGPGHNTIVYSYQHGLPANIPMSDLLHSHSFLVAGIIFAFLAVTSSYIANGTGLKGFIRDLCVTYLKVDNGFLVAGLTFLPPLFIALIYPQIFLGALTIVGGIGEVILFGALPGFILIRLYYGKNAWLMWLGTLMLVLSTFIFLYVVGRDLGYIPIYLPK